MNCRHKYAFFLTLLVMVSGSLYAQENPGQWGIGLSGGLASFSMRDLKEYQQEKEKDDFNARIVKSFPVYFAASFHVTYASSRKFFDLSVGRMSTGGRISYSDYSGEFAHDLIVVMGYCSASAGFRVASPGKVNVFAGGQLLLFSNLMKEKRSEKIYGGNSWATSQEYVSLNLAAAPAIEFHRRIGKSLLIRQQTSYEVHLPSALLTNDPDPKKLTNRSGMPVKVQAHGFRAKLGFVYLF